MTKSILIAIAVAALPVLAQDAPAQCPVQPGAPKCHRPCGPKGDMHKAMLEKFDANKDGQLDDQEKEAMKADFEAKKAEFEAKHGKPCGDKPACGPKGPRHHKGHGPKGDMHKAMLEKFDANKDGQLDDQEKEAMKADFEAKKAERKAKFMEKFDTNKDGQLDDQEKAAAKAEFEANAPKGPRGHKGCGPKGPKGCCPAKKD